MAVYSFDGAFANLNQSIAGLGKQMRDGKEREEFDALGKGIADGTIDYRKAAGRLTALGKLDSATELLKMGEAATTRKLGQDAVQGLFGVLGGGGGGGASPAPQQPAGQSLTDLGFGAAPASLIQSESGGRFDAQNNATGAGGMKGHFGRAQFGQARLQEAAAAGALPPGTTPQAFMASPELQQRAEAWHFGDIDQAIKQNGYDQLVGKVAIGGVPITVEGLRAVAHLGGKEGMRKFVETQGAYNPADANGTRLSDYFAQHGGGGRAQVAQASPDMPAPGASPAMMDSGQAGFAMLGSQPMDGRTFNGIQDGRRIDPTFQSEGVSQPWMNSALRQPPGSQVATRSSPPPPQRPYDLGADLPAPGASPAIGQMPQAAPPDLSNANDGGSRAFAMSQGANAPGSAAAFAPAPEGVRTARAEPMPGALGARPQPDQAAPRADMPAAGAVPAEGQAPRPAQAITPVPSAEMPRPTNMAEFRDFGMTKQMESAKGKVDRLALALANPNLPANARAVGELFLKEALEASKAPDSVKEYTYAKAMGWTTAKNPNEYAREKTKTTPAEEIEGRKASAAAAGLKPGDTGYQGYLLTGKMPREDMGPLTATDKKAILEADEAVLSNQSVIDNLRQAKELSAKAYAGPLAGLRGQVTGLAGNEAGQATTEYNNLVTANSLASLKAIFGGAPTEGERKILLDIQGSANLPHDLRVKILDRGIAMAEKRLGFNQQRADELRGGGFYKSNEARGQGAQPRQQSAPPQAQPQQQRQSVAAPPQAIEFLRANPNARQQFDAKYGQGASASVLGQ